MLKKRICDYHLKKAFSIDIIISIMIVGEIMKKIKKVIIVMMSVMMAITVSGCAKKGTSGTKTIMIYMIGSDLEAQYGFGSYNIKAIENSGVDLETTHILLKLGGSLSWQSSEIHENGGLYELGKDYKLKEINHDKENMCQGKTLTSFLNYGYDNYQTDSYDLILWDHGGGSILGYGYDEVYESTLKLTDIQKALSESVFSKNNQLELIGFDACLMSCIETAYVLKDYAHYMIASQETIPGYGWDYGFLKDVNGIMDGETISQVIVDHYIDFYEGISKKQNVYLDTTLSCLDLSKIDTVEQQMNVLFKKVDTSLEASSAFSTLSTSRNDVKAFGRSAQYSYDLVDLKELIEGFKKDYTTESENLLKSLDELIVYAKGNVDNASGVSVYYPYENLKNVSQYLKEYDRFDFADEYYQYLLNFANIIVSKNKSESQPLENAKLIAEKNEKTQRLTLELSQEEAKNYAGSKYCIMQKVEDMENAYMPIYWDTDLTLNGTTLTANYNNKVLTIVSGEDQFVTTLWQIDANDNYIRYQVPAIMYHFNDDFSDFKIIRSYFILHVDRQSLDVKLAGVVPAESLESNLAAKNEIDVSEYQEIQFLSTIMRVEFDKNNQPKAIRDWKSTGTMQAISVTPDEDYRFEFMDISEGEFYATVMVKDIYGNYSGSDIQKIEAK